MMGRRPTRRGVAAIEFAITLPVLLTIFIGVVEISLLLSRQYLINRAARDACRVGSTVIEGVDPTGDLIERAAEDHARFVLLSAGLTCAGGCIIDAEWYELHSWYVLYVTVDMPYRSLTGLTPFMPDHTRGEFTMLTQQQVHGS